MRRRPFLLLPFSFQIYRIIFCSSCFLYLAFFLFNFYFRTWRWILCWVQGLRADRKNRRSKSRGAFYETSTNARIQSSCSFKGTCLFLYICILFIIYFFLLLFFFLPFSSPSRVFPYFPPLPSHTSHYLSSTMDHVNLSLPPSIILRVAFWAHFSSGIVFS